MNTDQIKEKWQQIKGDLQKTWGKITDDEWEDTKGESSAVTGKGSELDERHIATAYQDDQSDDVKAT